MKNLIIFCLVAFLSHAAIAQETSSTPAPVTQKKSCCAAGAAKSSASCSADSKGEANTTPTTTEAKSRGMMVKKTEAVANKLETARFLVLGNCGMCKKTIEKAALGANATTADWDVKTDTLEVSFNAKKTSVDAIQKAVAKAGYDNAGYKADDKAYNNLHGCCQYDRTGAAGGTKSCTDSK